jgi:hypothetical protein
MQLTKVKRFLMTQNNLFICKKFRQQLSIVQVATLSRGRKRQRTKIFLRMLQERSVLDVACMGSACV